MIILAFVNDEGTAKDAVRSPHRGILISVFVLGIGVKACLDMSYITDTTLVNIIGRITALLTEGVEDATGRGATILKITELMNFDGVKTRLKMLELTDEGDKITGRLCELHTS